MRFHFGFSKHVSINTLFKIGLLFLGLVGISSCQKTLAWSNVNLNDFTGYKYEITESDMSTLYEGTCSSNCFAKSSAYIHVPYDNYNYYYPAFFQFATTNSFRNVYLSNYQEWYFNNNNSGNKYCSNSSSDLKSMNIELVAHIGDSDYLNYSEFSTTGNTLSNIGDVLGIFIVAYDDTNGYSFSTKCDYVRAGTSNYSGLFRCNGVFAGNSDYTIDRFSIYYVNIIPFNDRYKFSSTSTAITSPIWLFQYAGDIGTPMRFECSDDDPIVEGGFPNDDDPSGLNDIYTQMQDDFDSTIPGIDTSLMLVSLPTSLTDLMTMPLDLVNAIVQNSTSTSTCNTYNIDFSSIMTKWGDPNSSYILRLPCMRSVLSNLLNVNNLINLYDLADILLCFIIFYNMVMFFINVVDAITSGEDLFDYFFKASNEERPTKHLVNHDTGEVFY